MLHTRGRDIAEHSKALVCMLSLKTKHEHDAPVRTAVPQFCVSLSAAPHVLTLRFVVYTQLGMHHRQWIRNMVGIGRHMVNKHVTKSRRNRS
jgi:hypothetical protein